MDFFALFVLPFLLSDRKLFVIYLNNLNHPMILERDRDRWFWAIGG